MIHVKRQSEYSMTSLELQNVNQDKEGGPNLIADRFVCPVKHVQVWVHTYK